MKTALILEDHEDTRNWLRNVLGEAHSEIEISSAATIEQAIVLIENQHFSLALLDINLPDGSGIELIPKVIEKNRETFIVMMTIYDDDWHIVDALQNGAHGYLLKDQPRDRIIEQIKAIEQGIPPLSPAVSRRLLARLKSETHQPESETDPILASLSPRETEVLTLISKGLGRTEIAELLEISPNTISGYIKTLYRKLDINSRAEATLFAVRNRLVR